MFKNITFSNDYLYYFSLICLFEILILEYNFQSPIYKDQ
jgi:hypothetical protein